MARAQDAPTQGYTFDPYVQQSLLQGKQQSENRLVAAMQEKGARERQTQAGQQQAIQQGMAQAQERQMLAAQREQQDKRAAEAIELARQEREHRGKENEMRKELELQLAADRRAHEIALSEKDWERVQQAEKDKQDRELIFYELDRMDADKNLKAIIASMKQAGADASLPAKMVDISQQEYNKLAQTQEMYTNMVERAKAGALDNVQMDYPEPQLIRVGKGEPLMAPTPGRNPWNVLQRELSSSNTGITVEDLDKAAIHNIEKKVADGIISPVQYRDAVGTIEGLIEAAKEKAKSAEADSKGYHYWNSMVGQFEGRKSTLESLKFSNEPMKNNPQTKVGKELKGALGVNQPGTTISTRLAQLYQEHGTNGEAMMNEILKIQDLERPLNIPENVSESTKEIITRLNTIRMRKSPNADTSVINWGGAD